jgi:hypothetical protein
VSDWRARLQKWGFCSSPRLSDKVQDAALGVEMEAHAKSLKLAYTKGLMCHGIHPGSSQVEWTNEKLTQKKRRK